MKFTPRPPEQERPGSVKKSIQRLTSTGSNIWSSQGSLCDSYPEEKYGLAQQESNRDGPSSLPPAFLLGAVEEEVTATSMPPVNPLTSQGEIIPRPLPTSSRPFVMSQSDGMDDNRVLQDMQAGLLYFTTRTRELSNLTNLNQQMVQETEKLQSRIEHLEKENSKLQSMVDKLQLKLEESLSEADELKIQIDGVEKENSNLHDQTMDQWKSRMKIEDMYTDLQKSSMNETKALRAELNDQKKRNDALKRQLQERSSESCLSPTRSSLVSHSADLQMMDRISRLEDQLKHAVADRETSLHQKNQLQTDKNGLQCHLEKITTELETQTHRFNSLRKSFNDLKEDNEKLRSQLRGRRNSVGANSTWPLPNTKEAHSKDESRSKSGPGQGKDHCDGPDMETLHKIDLPPNSDLSYGYPRSNMSNGKRGHTKQRHSRQKSDGSSLSDASNTLPPVHKQK